MRAQLAPITRPAGLPGLSAAPVPPHPLRDNTPSPQALILINESTRNRTFINNRQYIWPAGIQVS